MKAVLCKSYGPPNTLQVEHISDLQPGRGQVVIQVAACAVNYPDLLIIENKYQYKPKLPFSPGAEISGRIIAIGEGVESMQPGDRVAAMTGWGGYAEQACVDADTVIPLPPDVDLETAAILFLTYGTSWYALKHRANVRPGETVLVLGAGGGTGLAAVELAHLAGATVIAAASSQDKLNSCKARGAHHVIDYSKGEFREQIKEITQGKGVDVVYDPVGGAHTDPALRSMAWGGRYLVIGFASGDIPRPPMNLPLLKGCSIVGVFFGAFHEKQPDEYRAMMKDLALWMAQGRIRPVISGRYPLERASAALQRMAARDVVGKLLIVPQAD